MSEKAWGLRPQIILISDDPHHQPNAAALSDQPAIRSCPLPAISAVALHHCTSRRIFIIGSVGDR